MTSYMAPLFTAFVYIPFGHVLVPLLEFWKKTAETVTFSEKPINTRSFESNPARITNQMFFFTVTAQIVSLATEVVVPLLKQKAMTKAKEFKSKENENFDHDEEAAFLQGVREECAMEVYDVTADYREMIMQFGKSES